MYEMIFMNILLLSSSFATQGSKWLRVKWKHWPICFSSWEVESNLQNVSLPKLFALGVECQEKKGYNLSVADLHEVAASLAKHLTWSKLMDLFLRVDKEMGCNFFDENEFIATKTSKHSSLHSSVPISYEVIPNASLARASLACKISTIEGIYLEVVNEVDDEPVPPNFTYLKVNRYSAEDISDIRLQAPVGCSCKSCNINCRKCCNNEAGKVPFAYQTEPPHLLLDPERREAIYECTSKCKCPPDTCANRVLQNGIKVPLQLFKTVDKGWGLKALAPVKKGQFVIEYVGDVIDSGEADARKGNTYLFDLDFNPDGESQYTIDAKSFGNLSRFINSCCYEANLRSLGVFVDCQDPDLPRMGFFANRDIEAGEELTFDYMMQGGAGNDCENCRCGSTKCRGNLVAKKEDNGLNTPRMSMGKAPRSPSRSAVAADPTPATDTVVLSDDDVVMIDPPVSKTPKTHIKISSTPRLSTDRPASAGPVETP